MIRTPADRALAHACRSWLNWGERMHAVCEASPGRAPPKHLREQFVWRMRSELRIAGTISEDDLKAAAAWLFSHSNGLVDWFAHAVGAAGVAIDVIGARPRVGAGALGAWVRHLDHFDEEVLAAFEVARVYGGAVTSYSDWASLMRGGDADIDTLVDRGVADMHVHLGGARQPPALWRRLLIGETKLADLPDFAPARLALADAAPARLERDLILSALGLRRGTEEAPRQTLLTYALSNAARPIARKAQTNAFDDYIMHRDEERWMLAHAWAGAFKARRDQSPELKCVVRALDHYAWARSRVNAHSRQPFVHSVHGLADFAQNWFRAVPQRRLTRLRRRKSPRLAINEHAEALGAICEQRALRRLELRISPLRTPLEYRRFFLAWTALERSLGVPARDERLDIRFAVHFQRRDDADPRRLMRAADRQSAALHLLRHLAPADARRISRIDLAGEERKGAGRWYFPFMRLLRGDESIPGDETIAPAWVRLNERKCALPAPGADRLGATCHAGEDFPDLLCGLYEIGAALEGLCLRAGDSLGHALALGWDADAFARRARSASWIKAGQAFDSRFWLVRRLARMHAKTPHGELLRSAAEKLAAEAAELYKDDSLRQAPWIDWAKLKPNACAPWSRDDDDPRLAVLLRRDFDDSEVRNRRAQSRPAGERADAALIGAVQQALQSEIAEKGVVVELNPSSNQRISGAGLSDHSPLVAMLKLADALSLSLSTDDPGVFGACIENEFALAAELMVENGARRSEALERLERIRRNALENIAWPRTGYSMDTPLRLEARAD